MFAGVDGYGHGDIGRETLDKIYAQLFGGEAALVSSTTPPRPHGVGTTWPNIDEMVRVNSSLHPTS